MEELSQIYVDNVLKYHEPASFIVLDRWSQSISYLYNNLQNALGSRLDLSLNLLSLNVWENRKGESSVGWYPYSMCFGFQRIMGELSTIDIVFL